MAGAESDGSTIVVPGRSLRRRGRSAEFESLRTCLALAFEALDGCIGIVCVQRAIAELVKHLLTVWCARARRMQRVQCEATLATGRELSGRHDFLGVDCARGLTADHSTHVTLVEPSHGGRRLLLAFGSESTSEIANRPSIGKRRFRLENSAGLDCRCFRIAWFGVGVPYHDNLLDASLEEQIAERSGFLAIGRLGPLRMSAGRPRILACTSTHVGDER